jgi:hypothetical protein
MRWVQAKIVLLGHITGNGVLGVVAKVKLLQLEIDI